MVLECKDTTPAVVNEETLLCPECKSPNIKKEGFSYRWKNRQRIKIRRYRCTSCGLLTTRLNDVNKLEGKHTIHCLRCDHTWTSKEEKPRRCAKCKSPYWDKPRGVNIMGKAAKVGSCETTK